MNKMLRTLVSSCKPLLSDSSGLLNINLQINNCNVLQVRGITGRYRRPLRIKYPLWFLQKERAVYQENISKKNREFIKEVMHDTFGQPEVISGVETYNLKTPLRTEPFTRGEWNIKSRRTGLLGRKIGVCWLWTNEGKQISTTLIQVADNHVIKYIPPEEYNPPNPRYSNIGRKIKNLACLLVGMESTDPQRFTKEYCGLFMKQGLMPKKILGRFLITPEAALQPGTPLYAPHFKVGDYVDVRGMTISRGFQGVMKRWGFHGMPATHGQTKTHRRPGCIGMGRDKKVQVGKKMPGHMGNKPRLARGLQILRMNTKYNVIYVQGRAVPGETNSVVYVYDTRVTHKRLNHHNQPRFPTYYPEELAEPLPEEIYAPHIYDFAKPSITFEVPKEPKKKK